MTPVLQYSNTPILQYSSTPILQYSNTPIVSLCLFRDRRDDLFDRLFRFAVGNAAGADNLVPASAVFLQQLADVDLRCRIENIVAHRDRRRVGSLGIFGDLDLNIALWK